MSSDSLINTVTGQLPHFFDECWSLKEDQLVKAARHLGIVTAYNMMRLSYDLRFHTYQYHTLKYFLEIKKPKEAVNQCKRIIHNLSSADNFIKEICPFLEAMVSDIVGRHANSYGSEWYRERSGQIDWEKSTFKWDASLSQRQFSSDKLGIKRVAYPFESANSRCRKGWALREVCSERFSAFVARV